MSLGRKAHGAGNRTRYIVDFSDWLGEGESLVSGTVVLDPAFTATVTDITISGVLVQPSGHLVFLLAGGAVSEVFTLDVQIVNSRTEIKNATLEFFVVAP